AVELSDLFPEHLLDPMLGHEDGRDRDAKQPRGLGAGAALERRQAEGIPGWSRDPLAYSCDRQLQQLAVEELIEPPFQVGASLDGLRERSRPVSDGPTSARDQVAQGMVGDRPQPGVEAARRVVPEARHLPGEDRDHVLGDVFGVRLLQAPVAAPAVDLRPVAPHESIPRAGVLGIPPQQIHQREGGLRVGAARHRASYGPYWGRPSSDTYGELRLPLIFPYLPGREEDEFATGVNSRVTSRHLAAARATLYISPLWCPRRGRRKPAILRRCPGNSLQETLSVKSLSRLK